MAKNYSDYLKDPRWQKLRLLVMQRDNFTCTLCGDNRTTLNVHHEAYNGKPWNISIDLLKTTCMHCHSVIHELEPIPVDSVTKNISLISKCWEVVAFCGGAIVFLYLFFDTDAHTGKTEIITVHTTNL